MSKLPSKFPMFRALFFATSSVLVVSCSNAVGPNSVAKESQNQVVLNSVATIEDGVIRLSVDGDMQVAVFSLHGDGEVLVSPLAPFHHVSLAGGTVIDKFDVQDVRREDVKDEFGAGVAYTISGDADQLSANLNLRIYEDFPGFVMSRVEYVNTGNDTLSVERWVTNDFSLPKSGTAGPEFWAFQGASYPDRRDWVQPLNEGYEQANFMGMNASDYGGGTPVVDVWRRDVGLAVGHIEDTPKLVSLPVTVSDGHANMSVEHEVLKELAPQETFGTFDTFVSVHKGDFYGTLKSYSAAMARRGLVQPEFPDTSYEAIWCAWGYERGFDVEQVLATLPKAKELGLKWAVLDDGWQTAEGDWYLNPEKFPRGDADMIDFVDRINDAGLKAKLWVAPLAVDPGTDLLHEHSDMLLLGKWGEVQDVTWWNSFYLCPAYGPTIEHTKKLVRTIMETWGYAGLKIDGQHLNAVAPCYNPAHNHERPEESVEALQDFWKAVYDTAISINPEAVVEICPCGTSYAFHNTPYMNQTVASDPEAAWGSSRQIRQKGKTLKALTGDDAPYYADHVELSDNANDFATAVGIGAVVGTKFTYPTDQHPEKGFVLTPEKEKEWAKWISIYNEKMLPKGIYRGELYDIGFDAPETHAIAKDGNMYFAFYNDKWAGDVELRGLGNGSYTLKNYITGDEIGVATAAKNSLSIDFQDYLLIEAIPVED